MEKEIIFKLRTLFEEAAQQQNNIEFWFARDLHKLLEYEKWENFLNVIEKAKISCKNSGQNILDHFPEVRKTIAILIN